MPLTPHVQKAIQILFRPEEQAQVAELLDRDCGAGLPLMGAGKEDEVERVQLAVLKCGKGILEGTLNAVVMAQKDWRDVLVGAGFGSDPTAHLRWDPKEINLAEARDIYMWYECDRYLVWHETGDAYARLGVSFEDERKWDAEWLAEHPGRKLRAEEQLDALRAIPEKSRQPCAPSVPKYAVQSLAEKVESILGSFYRERHFWLQCDKQMARQSSVRLFSECFAIVISEEDGLYAMNIGLESPGSVYNRRFWPVQHLAAYLDGKNEPYDPRGFATLEQLSEWLKSHANRIFAEEFLNSEQLHLRSTEWTERRKAAFLDAANQVLFAPCANITRENNVQLPFPRPPGFRLSPRDAIILAIAAGFYFLARSHLPSFAWFFPFVVAHFFFFCNMLRPGTKLELVWAGWFVAQLVGWAVWKGELALLPVLAAQMPVTLVITIITLRRPDYHGIFWGRINPEWKA